MADTAELKKHITLIEDKLKISISKILGELEIPVDFDLNDISIDFRPVQELGRITKNYVLRNVRLNVNWISHEY